MSSFPRRGCHIVNLSFEPLADLSSVSHELGLESMLLWSAAQAGSLFEALALILEQQETRSKADAFLWL